MECNFCEGLLVVIKYSGLAVLGLAILLTTLEIITYLKWGE